MIKKDLPLLGECAIGLNNHIQQGSSSSIYDIDVAELLGRNTVPLRLPAAHTLLKNRSILVTGAAGSIGSELCRQLLDYGPGLVIGLDTNETGLFYLSEHLRTHSYGACFQPRIGDITDKACMEHLFARNRPHIVFHVAAYKHVPLLEYHPDQAIRTNLLATYNLCRLAQKYSAERFIFVSTDKAANPTSIMGATKRFGEMIIRSSTGMKSETCFSAVRFGNVIGSRGSVVLTFAEQILNGGPITVTDPDATRYFMTIPEACDLVILSAALAECGSTYLLDMGEPMLIKDLALKMLHAHGLEADKDIAITYIGLRPGERLHEILVASNEELHCTAHRKIWRLMCNEETPTPAIIAEWVQMLERILLEGCHEQLRRYVFEFVQQRDLVAIR